MLHLDKDKKYLLACSFGTDSMTLFDILRKEGYNFSVAHINYNLREESTSETTKLTEICRKHNIDIFVKEVNTFLNHANLEAKCREIRYSYFKEIYDKYCFDALLVAHQEDDLIETYLLQKSRKSIVAFYGLKEVRDSFGMKIIRPMLGLSKEFINQYLLDNSVPHSIDKTNLSNDFKRNKIRHNVVEKLNKEEREKIVKEINNLNTNLCNNRLYLEKLNLNSINVLLKLSDENFLIALHLLLEKSNLFHPISRKLAKEIKGVIKSNKPNIEIELSNTVKFVKEYENIKFVFNNEPDDTFVYVLEKPGVLDTPYFYLNFLEDYSNRNVSLNDFPLTIRNARPNDEFLIKNYYVKMRRAFIDWKMPKYLRKRWPVICDKNNEVIYVPRYSKKYKINGKENFLVKS